MLFYFHWSIFELLPSHSTYVIVLLSEIHRLIFKGAQSTLRHNLYFDYKYKYKRIVTDVKRCDIICILTTNTNSVTDVRLD